MHLFFYLQVDLLQMNATANEALTSHLFHRLILLNCKYILYRVCLTVHQSDLQISYPYLLVCFYRFSAIVKDYSKCRYRICR